jgi:cell division protein FtsL
MSDQHHNAEGLELRSPQILTIKDLITIISVAVSLAIAWGVFDTRVTLLEKEVITLQSSALKTTNDVTEVNSQIKRLELRLQDDQHFIDDLYRDLKKPLPHRYDVRDFQ